MMSVVTLIARSSISHRCSAMAEEEELRQIAEFYDSLTEEE